MNVTFIDFFNSRIAAGEPVFFDGGMGTLIQTAQTNDASIVFSYPEELVFTRPDAILNIHVAYLAAGADILTANTFGATPLKMDSCTFCAADTVSAAIQLVKEAIRDSGKTAFAALNIGPTGKLLEPMGTLSFDAAYESYKTVAVAGEKAGADLVIIETMSDLYEAKAAVLAVKENTNLPVFITMTFQDSVIGVPPRTLTGADVQTCVTYLEALGVNALGFNCGGSLEDAFFLAEEFVRYTTVPVISQPNAGIPQIEDGKTVFTLSPADFAAAQRQNFLTGVAIVGGCCGTTSKHITALVKTAASIDENTLNCVLDRTKKLRLQNARVVRVCSYAQTVTLDEPVIIGERINPTGKPKCKEALRARNLQYIADEAASQIEAGAHILDVNTGLPDIDEKTLMVETIRFLQKTFSIPLQIDSADSAVLEKALRYYNGAALINSVNGKKETMDAVFPLAKKYGGIVVALALDETGIPQTADGRLAIMRRIVETAALYGLPKYRIVADALTLTVSSRQEDALETLNALKLIKKELGLKTVLGVSNISFGLPRRDILNAHFLSTALFAGLDACIINPLSQPMLDAFHASRVLLTHDKNCLTYLDLYAGTSVELNTVKKIEKKIEKLSDTKQNSELYDIILNGYFSRSEGAALKALEVKTAQEIIDGCIVPALDEAGKRYEKGQFFLPQLLLCADAASKIFAVLKEDMKKNGLQERSKGKIVIATVYGDVHDIGKNIAKAMLENYGYEVFDLGKNVAPETIVQKTLSCEAPLVGLSALMTTTVSAMQKTIELLRAAEQQRGKKIMIMVGGAVLSEQYAKQIGADFYAKDALAAVHAAKAVFGT